MMGGGIEVVAGDGQRVGCHVVEAGHPDAGLVLAALTEDRREDVELADDAVEPKPNDVEPPLRLGGAAFPSRMAQPGQVGAHHRGEIAPPAHEDRLHPHLRRRRDGRRGDHRHLQRERRHPIDPGEERARLLGEQVSSSGVV